MCLGTYDQMMVRMLQFTRRNMAEAIRPIIAEV